MRFDIDQNIVDKMSRDAIEKGLLAVGIFLEGEVINRVPVDSGALRDSVGFKVDDGILYVYANMEYAAIQEFGGEITPQQKQALAVPIHPDAKQKAPRDFSDLVLIKRANRPPLLVRLIGKGKVQRMDIMFVLVKSVHIPPQPYLGPALYQNQDKIIEVFSANAA